MVPIIAAATLVAMLIAGVRYPGVLIAGIFLTYQAGQLSGFGWLGATYAGAAALVTVVQYGFAPERLRFSMIDVAYWLVFVVLVVSLFWSVDPARTQTSAIALALSVVPMYLIGRLQRNAAERTLLELCYGLVIAGPIFGICMLAMRASGTYAASVRLLIEGAEGSAVGLAQPLPFVMLACGIAILQAPRAAFKAAAFAALAIMMYVSIVSGTRSVFLAFAIGMLVFVATSFRFSRLPGYLMTLLIALVGGMVLLSSLPPEVLERSLGRLLMNFGSGSGVVANDASSRERLGLYNAAVGIIEREPILGVGYGTFGRFAEYDYPHSSVMEMMVSAGVVGCALFILYVLVTVFTTLSIRRRNQFVGAMLLAMFACAFAQSLVSFAFYMLKPLFIISILAASFANARLAGFPPPRRARPARAEPAFGNVAPLR
jgi:O-antigen ligase